MNPDESYEEEIYFPLNISQLSPLDWALPLYGYLMPILIVITTITNSFIILVLSRRHLRTPTNFVLVAMAATDLLTGLVSAPWFFYYYTFGGYITDEAVGLSRFWCQAHALLFEVLPSFFHTAATWLTVFLAIQRYAYVCMPRSALIYCTPRIAKISIFAIIAGAFITLLPEIIGKRRTTRYNEHLMRTICCVVVSDWIINLGRDIFNSCYFWSRVILHTVPCLLLLVFTCKLIHTLKEVETRKKSWALIEPPRKFGLSTARISGASCNRSLYATNRMLAVICSVFLTLEIPAAALYGMQFLMAMSFVQPSEEYRMILNRILVIRHLMIVLASPIQFTIYCSMSEQFRLTVKQLFSSRLLFVAHAQATFHGGKRYSLILVNVDGFEKKLSVAQRFSTFFRASSFEREQIAHFTSLNRVRSLSGKRKCYRSTATRLVNYSQ